MRRVPFVLALLGLLSILVGLLAPSVGAQEPSDSDAPQSVGDDRLVVRSVDGRDPDAVVVEFLYSGPRDTVPDLVIRENGAIVQNTPPVLLEEETDFGIVLAIDTSASMADNGAFERAIDAAREFVVNKADGDQVAIVRFSDQVEIVQRFTDDDQVLLDALDSLGVGGFTALYDAVVESVNLFGERDLVPNVVLVTDGKDSSSSASLQTAIGRLDDTSALLFAIGIETSELDVGALEDLTEATGGAVLTSADPTELAALYTDVQTTIKRQFRTTFISDVETTGSVPLAVTIGTTSTQASYAPGARLDSTLSVEPVEVTSSPGVSALQSRTYLWVALGLVLLGVAIGAFAIGLTIIRDRENLDRLLQPYSDGFVARDPDEDDDRMATTSFISRAVDITGDFAERQGLLARVETRLEQANLPLRPAEAIFFSLAGAVLVGLLALLLGGFFAGLVVFLLGLVMPFFVLNFLASRRKKQFNAQLPDMLALLASTMRAGYSLMQGVEAAAHEVAEPMQRELLRVVTESQLGMPLEQALTNVADRMESRDFEWAVMAIGIQREVGGNLSELLDTVGATMTQRERLRRDINSLTAEGKISAIVLGILPIGLGAVIFTLNPDYMSSLTDKTIGWIMLIAAGVFMGIGFFWMAKMIDIEV